jgi:hypothetical protein
MGKFDEEKESYLSRRFNEAREYYKDKKLSPHELEHIEGYIKHGKRIKPTPPSQDDWNRVVPAKNGFHGYVNHPMKLLYGEAGKERIDIHKTRKRHNDHFWDVSEYFGGRF